MVLVVEYCNVLVVAVVGSLREHEEKVRKTRLKQSLLHLARSVIRGENELVLWSEAEMSPKTHGLNLNP